jgi:hypothetical protein
MRRPSPPLLPLVLAATVLIGCGHDQELTGTDVGSSSVPTRHSPSSRPSHTTSPIVSGPLDGFPLDLGYADENGDDGSPVEITRKPATRRFGVCGRTVWDPRHGTTGVFGVEFRGEAEYSRGRTLVLYADAGAATAAVAAARDAVSACSDEPGREGQGTTHTMTGASLGDQAVVWTDTFYWVDHGEHLYGTGLVVYEVVRVGRAVLLAYEYGEGNGTPASRAQAIARSTRAETTLVERMSELSRS